jgi:hypothetical protein
MAGERIRSAYTIIEASNTILELILGYVDKGVGGVDGEWVDGDELKRRSEVYRQSPHRAGSERGHVKRVVA